MGEKTELVVISYFDNGIFRTASIQHSTPEYTEQKIDEMLKEGCDILDVMRYDSDTHKPITDVMVEDNMEERVRQEIENLEDEIHSLENEIDKNHMRIKELKIVLKEITKQK